MRFDHYANRAAVLAAELVNAQGDDDLLEVVHTIGEGAAPTLADLVSLRGLATELRPIFTAQDPIAEVNAALQRLTIAPRVTRHDDRGPHLHFDPPGASVTDRLRANTVLGLAAVVCDESDRLGVCESSGCEVVYVDTSRNGRRRFCSDTCANRFHVAAHRARRKIVTGRAS